MKVSVLAAAGTAFVFLATLSAGMVGSTSGVSAASCAKDPETCYRASVCKNSPGDQTCGVITFINKSWTVSNPTIVSTESSQPSNRGAVNSKCANLYYKYTADVDVGEYIEYILPANCAYHLKIDLGSKKKTQHIWLTPGCSVKARVLGTASSNHWNTEASYVKAAQDAGMSGTPVDETGANCGAY